ncbi:MAG: hypothetical protein E5Y88_18590 [Mesorhizobium sp.]|nr:hypothetical protein EOC94_00230 [Mesorhizobium sp. M6A.T.Ce.TU.016.01.1.1]RWQ36069.1 MAG: hypothetical protein EOS20_16750 [Mesorhizobium sp.]TIL24370.1 MAG: hypothetical protein E5Y88_18590 [Mesorhizobium sp.]TIM50827.1 MAG: hypothetical protein E5Y69_07105 [Mesorhizobium sp.]
MFDVRSQGTPLWPAGHLPLKGGDWMSPRLSPITNIAGVNRAPKLLISPLEGEMSGRTEGGAVERSHLENERRTGAPA